MDRGGYDEEDRPPRKKIELTSFDPNSLLKDSHWRPSGGQPISLPRPRPANHGPLSGVRSIKKEEGTERIRTRSTHPDGVTVPRFYGGAVTNGDRKRKVSLDEMNIKGEAIPSELRGTTGFYARSTFGSRLHKLEPECGSAMTKSITLLSDDEEDKSVSKRRQTSTIDSSTLDRRRSLEGRQTGLVSKLVSEHESRLKAPSNIVASMKPKQTVKRPSVMNFLQNGPSYQDTHHDESEVLDSHERPNGIAYSPQQRRNPFSVRASLEDSPPSVRAEKSHRLATHSIGEHELSAFKQHSLLISPIPHLRKSSASPKATESTRDSGLKLRSHLVKLMSPYEYFREPAHHLEAEASCHSMRLFVKKISTDEQRYVRISTENIKDILIYQKEGRFIAILRGIFDEFPASIDSSTRTKVTFFETRKRYISLELETYSQTVDHIKNFVSIMKTDVKFLKDDEWARWNDKYDFDRPPSPISSPRIKRQDSLIEVTTAPTAINRPKATSPNKSSLEEAIEFGSSMSAESTACRYSTRIQSISLNSDKKLFNYPFVGIGAITITREDESRLDDGEFLNDNIIEFYLKWQHLLENPQIMEQVHIFNTFFFKRLTSKDRGRTEDAYERVKKWTAKLDLLSKKYIFVPINENLHWYLVMIGNPHLLFPEDAPAAEKDTKQTKDDSSSTPYVTPAEDVPTPKTLSAASSPSVHEDMSKQADNSEKDDSEIEMRAVPRIRPTPVKFGRRSATQSDPTNIERIDASTTPFMIVLDSLGSRHPNTFGALRSFLKFEGKLRLGRDIKLDGLMTGYAKVAFQTNYCDCGVYLLHYVEKLLSNPDVYLDKLVNKEEDKQVWSPGEMHTKRQQIRDVLHKVEEQYAEFQASQPKSDPV
ncbi:hypothetical protein BZG36_01090 [Bifiguratus adelaidae]|uniref:Ubiquitin-like protease family profile domain-containing protein n=1 Tax=Bifiguratus adelaidae TaxID=1938954 RepID=A0A261Y603_9FUNG|nr:hypothetical protein BZG36_01090 [Bifiguratus adelaidae]